MTILTGEELTKKPPEKALTEFRPRSGGLNDDGRMKIGRAHV